jgi:transcriptional regulator with XRE-family HTH domain
MTYLKIARRKAKLSQLDVARKLNISRQTYNYWETGSHEINKVLLPTLASILNVSEDYLLKGNKPDKTIKKTISEKILDFMDEFDVTDNQLAKEVGISEDTIDKWKSNPTSDIDTHIIKRIASYFNTPVDLFFNDEEIIQFNSDIVRRIFYLITLKGINAAKMARDIGLRTGLISQWRHSNQNPSVENLVKIADYFGVTTDYLIKGDNSNKDLQINNFTFKLVGIFNELNEEDKKILIEMAHYLQYKEKKQE